MSEDSMKNALENISRRGVPENTNLWPNISARLERKSLMQTIRTRPLLMAVITIVALLLLSGVVYALGRSLGYIPGIGIVDQSTQVRVLAEPISVTRDEIILTVEQVVLSADKTVLIYKIEGIPEDAYAPWEENTSNSYSSVVTTEGTPDNNSPVTSEISSCVPDVYFLLPNGSTWHMHTGEGTGWMTGFENRLVYEPLPAEVNEVTLIIPCVEGTLSGRLPENWEVPLRFVSAPPELTVLPVVEVTPSTPDNSQSVMTLEKVIETDEGYILVGNFHSIDLPMDAQAQGLSDWVKITDANGQLVDAVPFNNLESVSGFGKFPWGCEISGKPHAWPLTLTIGAVNATFYEQKIQFEFDTGPDPQMGKKWILDQDIQLAGYTIRVVSIERTSNGYSFIFKSDPDVTSITPDIKGFPYLSSSGWSDGYRNGDLFFIMEFEEEPPSGKLEIELVLLSADIHGPWQVQWSPESILPTP